MKLISIDLETTGLNPETDQILEVGAVVFDPEPQLAVDGKVNEDGRRWKTFEAIIRHDRIEGDPFALGMSADIINEIAGRKQTHVPIVSEEVLLNSFTEFLLTALNPGEKATIVGKNFDKFDLQFLQRRPWWKRLADYYFERRTLDVGSLVFNPKDGKVLNLTDCLEKLGAAHEVPHRALNDALLVATCVTRFFS